MSVGTAVFLSAILISVVLLYGFTRDRWRWGRIVGRTLLGVVGLVFLAAALIFGGAWWSEMSRKPVVLTSLWGVSLGETENDVIFKKGNPTEICTNSVRPENKSLWFKVPGYTTQTGSWAQVVVNANRSVIAVLFHGDLSLSEQQQPLRIYQGQSADSVVADWGQPGQIVEGKFKTGRSYYFDRYNFIVAFNTNKAEALVVRDHREPFRGLAPRNERSTEKCVPFTQ